MGPVRGISTIGHLVGVVPGDEGLLNKQIAQRLGITERTVKAHLTSAYQRIGVADRTQAALGAQRHDLGGSATGPG